MVLAVPALAVVAQVFPPTVAHPPIRAPNWLPFCVVIEPALGRVKLTTPIPPTRVMPPI